MAPPTGTPATKGLDDAPLNYRTDQRANLNPLLRRLDAKLGLESALELVSDPASGLLLAAAAGALVRRRYALASFFAAGLIVKQALARRNGSRFLSARQLRELEFERRVLKVQRGDYGNLQPIAFK